MTPPKTRSPPWPAIFAANRLAYQASAYKEAHARQEFIDPLFAALGWDVANAQHAAPDYREVVVEDSLEIAGQKKAPDYVFRVGRERKFFVEAKKPGVALKTAAGPLSVLRQIAGQGAVDDYSECRASQGPAQTRL